MESNIPHRFEDGLGYYIHQLMYAMRQTLAKQCQLGGYKITSEELVVLMVIAQSQDAGGLAQMQIAETLAKDKAVITRLLNNLNKLGLIVRTPGEKDRRVVRVTLSLQGQQAVDTLKPQLIDLLAQIYEGISDEEFLQTRDVLQRLLTNIKAVENR